MVSALLRKKWSFRISIATLVIALVITLSAAMLWVSYSESSRGAVKSAQDLFDAISGKLIEQTNGLLSSVAALTNSGARFAGMYDPPGPRGTDPRLLEFMTRSLDQNPQIYSVAACYQTGAFVQVIACRSSTVILEAHQSPENTAYIIRTVLVKNGNYILQDTFKDQDMQFLSVHEETDQEIVLNYMDHFSRDFIQQELHYTSPSLLPTVNLPGITCVKSNDNMEAIFSVAITLANFDTFLWNQEISPFGSAFLFDFDQTLLAHPREPVVSVIRKGNEEDIWFLILEQSTRPEVRAVGLLFQEQQTGALGKSQIMAIEGEPFLIRLSVLENHGFSSILSVLAPIQDFTGHIKDMQQRVLLLSLFVLVLGVLAAYQLAQRVSRSLANLVSQANQVQRFDFSEPPLLKSKFIEVHALIQSFTLMRETIRNRTNKLISAQEDLQKLMDSFIKVIAGAIDAKSPYTGRHCSRVPVLAELLAREAVDANHGSMAGFQFKNKEEWREFMIAAWLHDCGKVTTPEYVADKATKLETIHNRIHEVRMRFEILSRDLEIASLQAIQKQPGKKKELLKILKNEQNQLQEEFALVARCNQGGESMTDEDQAGIRLLAKRSWKRRFNDSLGLSSEEEQRWKIAYPNGSPLEQYLLTDKPEHVIPHENTSTRQTSRTSEFLMERPQHRCNFGELHNLLINKGTLTSEERYLIKEHIIHTVLMLDRLPFPDNLARVPEYAGAHHETLDGSGYPYGLSGEQISIPARILAISDIFEALTATDRPYKPAMTACQAFTIMEKMVRNGRIDHDLFVLFRDHGVWQRYGEQYLQPSQIDC